MQAPFQLSQADPRPMYEQIMEHIKQLVITAQWAAGESLPSIRELAVALKVSVITVKRAYQELEQQGVIVTRQGKGSFVADQVDLASKEKREELHALLKRAASLAKLLSMDKEMLIDAAVKSFDDEF